ncbi:MAG: aminoglycoside phosphotransferase family protein [Planctomycetota bacterium]
MHDLQPDAILAQFSLAGPILSWERYGNGHINDTLLVRCAGGDYVAQRLNRTVFSDGAAVMNNIARVLWHLATTEPDASRRLSLIPTRGGQPWLVDHEGFFWRVYPFMGGTKTIERVTAPGQAYAAACAFADFLAKLSDVPGEPLTTVIPAFHDTPDRLAKLAAAARSNRCGRLSEVECEVTWALNQTQLAGVLIAARTDGRLAETVTHNDTKVNNILMAADGCTAKCVIDLDTLMPGLAIYDFADLVRTASSRAAEDADPRDMVPESEFLAALVEGWLSGRGDAATTAERELMPIAGAVMTFECGIRFLTDYLQGDRYFRIKHPQHNRDRARSQLALARALLIRTADISELVSRSSFLCSG